MGTRGEGSGGRYRDPAGRPARPCGHRAGHRLQGQDPRSSGCTAESAGKYDNQPHHTGREPSGRGIPHFGRGCGNGNDRIRPQPDPGAIDRVHAGSGQFLAEVAGLAHPGLERFQFERLRVPNHPAWRFAAKMRFFPLTFGRAARCRRLASCLFQRENTLKTQESLSAFPSEKVGKSRCVPPKKTGPEEIPSGPVAFLAAEKVSGEPVPDGSRHVAGRLPPV